jgi:hypothetical protein
MSSVPIGTFRAHSTRDGEALARNGQPYYAINRLSETFKPERERDLFKILFADDLWMLARLDDLVQVVQRASA